VLVPSTADGTGLSTVADCVGVEAGADVDAGGADDASAGGADDASAGGADDVPLVLPLSSLLQAAKRANAKARTSTIDNTFFMVESPFSFIICENSFRRGKTNINMHYGK
jgi:hypothetical protein